MSESGPSWDRIESLFHGALELPESQRRAWLEQEVGADRELLDQLLTLIARADDNETLFESVVGQAALDLSGMATQPGSRLGPYRIVRRLGSGGMGEVFLAERDDEEYRQQVAIKVIRGFSSADALERFRRERQILADLQHPHIARLLDGGTMADGQPYLVMDFVDGVPLRQWCREQQPSRQQCLRLMLRICDAIHHAHQHLIIHRDIKPGNVLVTGAGEPVLLDFGIARLLDDQEAAEFSPGPLAYTPGFASPEQLAGKPVTTASDIYSLGRLLLALLDETNSPHEGPRLARSDPALCPDQVAGLPRDLMAIAAKATREEPEQRYDSVTELRADLARFLDQQPVLAMPTSLRYRLGKFARRNRPGLLVGVLALLLLSTAGWRLLETDQRANWAESRAVAESAHAEQILDVLLEAISAAAPGQARGQAVTVRQVIDQSYARLKNPNVLGGEGRDRLLLSLGEVYLRLEEHNEAAELLTQAASSSTPAVSIRALSLLGFSLVLRKQVSEAESAFVSAFALLDRHRDELPEAIVRELQNHHALWLLEVDQPLAAGAVFAHLVQANLDAGQLETAARMLHNLALAESAQGRWYEAAEHLRRSLTIKEEVIGRLHPSYALSLANLAGNLTKLGEYQQAREALTESLALRVRLFGDHHVGLHFDYNELGSMHHDQGDFARAIELYQQALALHEASGEAKIGAVNYINNLAFAYEDRGEWQRAEPLFRQSLAIRAGEYGAQHASTIHAKHNLARLLIRLGQLEEAELLAEEVIAFRAESLGPDHQATAYSRTLAAMLAHARGDLVSARLINEQSLSLLGRHLPPTNGWVLTTRGLLARALVDAGHMDQAESILAELIEDYQNAFGNGHPHAAVLGMELARVEQATGRDPQASARLNELAEYIHQRLAPDSAAWRQLDCLRSGQGQSQCWSAVSAAGASQAQG